MSCLVPHLDQQSWLDAREENSLKIMPNSFSTASYNLKKVKQLTPASAQSKKGIVIVLSGDGTDRDCPVLKPR